MTSLKRKHLKEDSAELEKVEKGNSEKERFEKGYFRMGNSKDFFSNRTKITEKGQF